jgi:predicted DNA-binding transcriptional regulator AlpA
MESLNIPQGDRFLREGERAHITGLSRTTWWRLERQGRAPKRRHLSENAVGWLESEIREWMANRAAGRVKRPTAA